MKLPCFPSVSRQKLAVSTLLFTFTSLSHAIPADEAKRIHERLAGVAPSVTVLNQMIAAPDGEAAAMIAMDNDNFYRVTIKNWAAPWTNRDQDVFVPLNDYIATVMGYIKDGLDFRGILYEDRLYTFSGITPAYANNNNQHYENAEASDPQTFSFATALSSSTQSSLNGLPSGATAGVITSRAAAEAFFVDGTNRAMFRYTLLNHLCMDLEQMQDPSLPPDRIRQDVSRSPGGDSRVFVNNCVTCHNGMDPMAQAFAYYDFDNDGITDEAGNQVAAPTMQMVYNRVGETDIDEKTNEDRGTRVQRKYHINENTFVSGYVTPNDTWNNYWRGTANGYLGWNDGGLNNGGTGSGAKSLGMEFSYSDQFAQCQVEKVFKAVCLRDPINTNDRAEVASLVSGFTSGGYNLKNVFASTADYCKSP